VTWSKPHPEFARQGPHRDCENLGLGQDDAVAQLLPAGAIYFSMDEADVRRILSFSPTMIGSDGLPHDAFPHPAPVGDFPRVLGHYSRTLGLFSLEQRCIR
jgi:N-acyl-D-amino-acid deacylase